ASSSGVVGGVRVSIEHNAACARFDGAVIRGVKVGPSPEWLRRRLEAVGLRSISNVVDATNYVMLELGQPLHAYDLAHVPGPARKAVGLPTEASQRFERGTDLWGIPDALRRCVEIVLATAGGTLDGAPLDLWPEPSTPPRIFLRTARCAQVLGVELPVHELER